MNDKKRQNRRGKPRGDASEIGVVRVFSNPGPDAEDRLRRALSLMIKYATRDRQAAHGEDAPTDAPPGKHHDEAEG